MSLQSLQFIQVPVSVLILLAAPSASAHAQDKDQVKINWKTKEVRQGRILRGNSQGSLLLERVNHVCYAVTTSVNQIAAPAEQTAKLAELLSKMTPMPGAIDAPKAPKDTTIQKSETPAKPPTAKDTIADPYKEVRSRLRHVADRMDSVEHLLETSEKQLAAVTGLQRAAKAALTEFYAIACPSGKRGAEFDVMKTAFDSKSVEFRPYIESTNSLAEAKRTLEMSAAALDSVSRDFADLIGSADPTIHAYVNAEDTPTIPGGAALRRAIKARLTAATATLNQHRKEVNDALVADRSAFTEQIDTIRSQLNEPDWERFTPYIKDGVDGLEITVTSTGRSGIPGIAGSSLADKYEIPVVRRARVMNGIGILLTTIPERDYERVTRPRFAGDTNIVKDSTYSTYELRAGGTAAVAPLVQTGVSVYDLDDGTLYLSGGIAMRSVNNNVLPEYIVGVAGGVLDKLLLTVGWHWGRRERLLLGEPSEVRRRPVPAGITDGSAVGTEWKNGFAAAISWRF